MWRTSKRPLPSSEAVPPATSEPADQKPTRLAAGGGAALCATGVHRRHQNQLRRAGRPDSAARSLSTDLVRGGFQPRLPTSLPPPGQQQQPSPLPRRQPVPLMPPAQLHPGAPQVVAPAPAVPLQSPPPSELMDVDPSAGPPSQAVAVQPVLQPLSLGTPKESDTAAPCPAPTQQPSTQRQETLPLFVVPDASSRPVPEAVPVVTAAASSVGESPSTTPQPSGAEVPTASAHRSVVGTQPPSLSGSDTGVPSDRDCVEPRPPVDVESRTRKQKSPKRHKKRRLSVEEQDRDVNPAEDIDFVDSSTTATDSSGIIHQKVPEDKEHTPKFGGPENEAHCVDSQNVGSCENDQPPMTSQTSLGDWADDMEADDAQRTSISPSEPMADIEPGGLCQSGTHTAQ
ncbi:SH3 domain-containing protein C23A1.17-like [Schistocerca americana]|uniref:SH3 domain-containing protein C23A1.17-like n=1 Tax=Schistocerca americana TaxID=7009 RepID=UPI001F4F6FBC|nr:SH3 domain-containing protein C23A1.17-like [Schistocerca americana]